jgi:bifunctional DNase/RNase
VSQGWATQQDELVKQRQAKVISTESMVVDIIVFQAQALEVRKEFEEAKKKLLTNVETFQDHFQVIDHALNKICLREREDIVSWTTFQEAIVSSTKVGVVVSPRPSHVVNQVLKGIVIMFYRLVSQVLISWRIMCC